jgi:hypothetical protein
MLPCKERSAFGCWCGIKCGRTTAPFGVATPASRPRSCTKDPRFDATAGMGIDGLSGEES